MPSVVALFLTLGFVVFLFRRESRQEPRVSGALWIPLIWMFFSGSRFLSEWLNLGAYRSSIALPDEGSPLDAAVFAGLITAGLYVLGQRRVRLSTFFRNNRWLTLFLLYCLISVLWSEYPFVAFKRWIKVLGHPIMALVVLTEANPQEAVRRLFKRSAYLLLPLSILFIKYYPEYSKAYDPWSGVANQGGVTHNKNELGYDCLMCGIFFVWNLLQALKIGNRAARRKEVLLSVGFLFMVWYLLSKASSATSLTCILLGTCTMLVLGLRVVNKRFIGTYLVVGILAFAVAEPVFGIYGTVLKLLNRNVTLTDRTEIWSMVLQVKTDPIFGAGFESFWLQDRVQKLWSRYFFWVPNQAHNGYLETYLNLGIVGLILLAAVLLATFSKVRASLLRQFQFGRLRMGFFIAILLYNYTEAAFKGVHLLWTVFFLIAVEYPRPRVARPQVVRSDPEQPEVASVAAGQA